MQTTFPHFKHSFIAAALADWSHELSKKNPTRGIKRTVAHDRDASFVAIQFRPLLALPFIPICLRSKLKALDSYFSVLFEFTSAAVPGRIEISQLAAMAIALLHPLDVNSSAVTGFVKSQRPQGSHIYFALRAEVVWPLFHAGFAKLLPLELQEAVCMCVGLCIWAGG